ncbi:hypothetical protein Egran_00942 [Elaphomyces granulatus]|uniref:M-phase inducer phosphatase n=1 Tax=Elaphomyces granulatus TaxID=519963 RepID=A0A232M4M8_9EURO|nr:hypothetical protein Egran_00942 [Elaphomyces granulatus]
MEHSSPLAALQPSLALFGHGFCSDVPASFPSFGAMNSMGSSNFNFKDLAMKKAKPIHGSSPAGSLAADLSQNFHIDRSPQLVTPRRSLFSSKRFGAELRREETMTTPPLLSSSPATNMDMMDMSPLPHKIPFTLTTQVELLPPTPDVTMSLASSPLQESPAEGRQPKVVPEKRRPNFLRPSLIRTKAHVAPFGLPRPAPESQSPPFKFGNGVSTQSTGVSMSLEDMFGASPPQDRHSWNSSSSTGLGPRLKSPFSLARCNDSPLSGSIRKNSRPLGRPRKQCRRSLSMFEHPDDIVRPKDPAFSPDTSLDSIIDIEAAYPLQLPHFIPEDQPDSLPRIDKGVLVDLLDGKYNDRFENIMVIDCRFEYEFEGGHINGAINHNDKELLSMQLLSEPKAGTVLVFHCEYSAHRAPIMASFIRHQDRALNVDQYPKLSYPEMYILDGGYSAFFAEHRSLCYPQNYVEMSSKEHEYACERGLSRVKQRSKLSRAKTFAFGQQSPQMEDSPTGRCRSNCSIDRDLRPESPFGDMSGSTRLAGRRMLSY